MNIAAQLKSRDVETQTDHRLWHRLKSGQVGFKMTEIMSGHHRFEQGCGPEGYHPFEFEVVWGPDSIVEWLNPFSERFMWQELRGVVRVGGLCEEAECRGTFELRYFDERRIRYQFDFEVDGVSYCYLGEKVNIQLWNLPVSHTTCFGNLTEKESGKLISTSVTYFKLHTTPAFLASLRLHTTNQC